MSVIINTDPSTFKKYSTYQLTTKDNGKYFLCIPDEVTDKEHLYLGFFSNNENLTDKDKVLKEVEKMYSDIKQKVGSVIFAIPLIPYRKLIMAREDNDLRLYQMVKDDLQKITIDISKRFKDNLLGINLRQIIIMIQNDIDLNLADWLEMTIGSNNVKGLRLNNVMPLNWATPIYDDTTSSNNSGPNLNDSKVNENSKAKVLTPPNNSQHGFSSFSFSIIVLILAIVLGLGIAYIIK